MKHRAGTNLIELVVVMSLQTVLLGTTVGLIGRLLEAEQVGRTDLETLMSLDALAEQFRRDVNAAGAVSIRTAETSPRGLDLDLSENRLAAYEIHPDRVLRSEKRADDVLRREAYRLPRQWTVTFQKLSDEPRRMLRLEVLAPAAAGNPSSVPRLICDAVVGRDPDAALPAKGGNDDGS